MAPALRPPERCALRGLRSPLPPPPTARPPRWRTCLYGHPSKPCCRSGVLQNRAALRSERAATGVEGQDRGALPRSQPCSPVRRPVNARQVSGLGEKRKDLGESGQRRSLGGGLQRGRSATYASGRRFRTGAFPSGGGGPPHSSRDARGQRWRIGETGPPGGLRGTGQEARRGGASSPLGSSVGCAGGRQAGLEGRWGEGAGRGRCGGPPAPQLPRTPARPGRHQPASTPARDGARARGRKAPQPPGAGAPGPAREAQ